MRFRKSALGAHAIVAIAVLATAAGTAVAPAASAASAPAGPDYVNVSWPGAGMFKLGWDTPATDGGSPITDYLIQVTHHTSTGDDPPTVVDTGSTKLTHTVSGLVDGDYYLLAVAAVNSVGQSDWTSMGDYLQSVPGLFPSKDVVSKHGMSNGKPWWNIGAQVDSWPPGATDAPICIALAYPGDPHGSLSCANADYKGHLTAPTRTHWYGQIPLGKAISVYAVPHDSTNNVYGIPGWLTVQAWKLSSQSKRTVAKGSKVTLTTRMTDTTGAAVGYHNVRLYACHSTSCTKVVDLVTSPKGYAHRTVTVKSSTTFRWMTLSNNPAAVIPAYAKDVVAVS